MRRTTTAAILLAATLALAGCGSNNTAATPKASPTVSKETAFLTAARRIEFNGTPSDDALLALPPKWCSALDAGHSVKWMFNNTTGESLYPVGDDWGTVSQDANTLLVAGVTAYCPKYAGQVKQELRDSGGY